MFVLANSLKKPKKLLVKKTWFKWNPLQQFTIFLIHEPRSVDNIARLFWVKNSDLSYKLKKIRVRHFFWDLFKADLKMFPQKNKQSHSTRNFYVSRYSRCDLYINILVFRKRIANIAS